MLKGDLGCLGKDMKGEMGWRVDLRGLLGYDKSHQNLSHQKEAVNRCFSRRSGGCLEEIFSFFRLYLFIFRERRREGEREGEEH